MTRATRYSPEVQARAVRMVAEHVTEYESQWAAIVSIAGKMGCTAETLRRWVRQPVAERRQMNSDRWRWRTCLAPDSGTGAKVSPGMRRIPSYIRRGKEAAQKIVRSVPTSDGHALVGGIGQPPSSRS